MSERQRILWLRALALRNIRTAYEPHRERIERLVERGVKKTRLHEDEINRLTWRYRRQVSAELVPYHA